MSYGGSEKLPQLLVLSYRDVLVQSHYSYGVRKLAELLSEFLAFSGVMDIPYCAGEAEERCETAFRIVIMWYSHNI